MYVQYPRSDINLDCYWLTSLLDRFGSEELEAQTADWLRYVYIMTDACYDLKKVIIDNKAKERLFNVLPETDDHKKLINKAIKKGISPLVTVRELINYASLAEYRADHIRYYTLLQEVLSLKRMQAWFKYLKQHDTHYESIFDKPTSYANCKLLALLLKHNLYESTYSYTIFNRLLILFRYRKENDKHSEGFEQDQLDYMALLREHNIHPSLRLILSSLCNYNEENLEPLLKQYPILGPLVCSAIIHDSMPTLSFLNIVKEHGTNKDLRTLLEHRSPVLKLIGKQDIFNKITSPNGLLSARLERSLKFIPSSTMPAPTINVTMPEQNILEKTPLQNYNFKTLLNKLIPLKIPKFTYNRIWFAFYFILGLCK